MKLGDMVKAATDLFGIPQCEPCKRRQEKLNALGERLGRKRVHPKAQEGRKASK